MATERTEKLAIWLDDIERLPHEMRRALSNSDGTSRINYDKIHRVGQGEKNEEQPALEFCCDLTEAALICDLIRSYNRKVGERPSEIYINRSGEDLMWRRITYNTVLTLKVNGQVMLNPVVFPVEAAPIQQVAARPFRIGKK